VAGQFSFLDAGPLWLACRHPRIPGAIEINLKLTLWQEHDTVVLPEIADYEVRRELIRRGDVRAVQRLDNLRAKLVYLPLNTEAIRRAADLWAQARGRGQQTAGDEALDADVILAAQALEYTGLGDEPVVITDNNRHLGRFVKTSSWMAYTESPGLLSLRWRHRLHGG
jgi:predicted nucleic acid-binding protein